MNKYYIIGAVVVVLGGIIVLTQGSRHTAALVTQALPTPTTAQTASAHQPTAAQPAAATTAAPTAAAGGVAAAPAAEDIVPGLYPNPINNIATTAGFKVASLLVENNTDAAGNAVSDHLQFTLQNLTDKPLTNFQVYYTITDTVSGKQEGYYKPLTGFSLAPHSSGTVNFDGKTGAGHYGVNMHGIYGTTMDKLQFKVEISTPGYAPVYATATKAPGGAEVVGQ